MILPHITKTQKYILFLLYKFRFLNTYHIQKLLNHKNPKRIQIWLKDLKDKEYINIVNSPKTFADNTKPYIYHLSTRARRILKTNEDCNLSVLSRIYKEKKRTETFINYSLAIADTYLFFISQKESNEELHFFTESELVGYDYLPDPLPSAYIAVKTEAGTRRYFLDLFNQYDLPFIVRERFKIYLQYADSGNWEANANDEPLPSILFVCPSVKKKKHINFYASALLKKTYDDKITLFLTTKDKVLYSKDKNIWEKVSASDE